MNGHGRSPANRKRSAEPISFGPFQLYVSERRLEKDGSAIVLPGHAIDILILLVERAGEVVSKAELLARIWPSGKSDERNLRVYVTAIRKALDTGKPNAGHVTTVSGQGYCFVARVSGKSGQMGASDAPALGSARRLPAELPWIVGRDQAIEELSDRLCRERFVTIVGPGGIGKTTVAISAAHALLEHFSDAIYFFDFGAIDDPALVPTVVASAFGLAVKSIDPLDGLAAYLRDKRVLLIFDCCEHVIEVSAALAERLHGEAPQLHILTTSREQLRVEGEQVYRLTSLEYPPDEQSLTAAQALVFTAVQLFVEYATAHDGRFLLNDDNALLVGDICRKLDGIALAIELAAKRASTHGINETFTLLNDQFALLWQGRRTAAPRHQTLRATIEWSYNLLSLVERVALVRLSIFSGTFTMDSACVIVAADDITQAQVIRAVESLVAKSLLVSLLPTDGPARFRLQDTTRHYAAEKLLESGDNEAVTRRHVRHFSDLLGSAMGGTGFYHRQALSFVPHLDNLRKALSSSFSGNEVAESTELVARAAPVFLELSLYTECRKWCERALSLLPEQDPLTQGGLDLQEAHAVSFLWTHNVAHEIRDKIEHGIKVSEVLGDDARQVRFLVGLNISFTGAGNFSSALDVAMRCAAVARRAGLTAETVVAEWVLGAAHHFAGDQVAALSHCERGFRLESEVDAVPENVFGFDHRARGKVVMARSLWLRGLSDQAYQMADQIVRDSADNAPPISRSIAAIYTIPVFLWMGRFDDAAEPIEQAIANSLRSPFPRDHAIGRALKGELLVARGDVTAGVDLLRSSLKFLQALRLHITTPAISCALCDGLVRLGRPEEALNVIGEAVARVNAGKDTFWLPSLLRVQGEVLLAIPRPDFAAAESSLLRSIKYARDQFALGWELKSSIALAQTWAAQCRRQDARQVLENIVRQFTEGFGSKDLVTAKTLLDELDCGC